MSRLFTAPAVFFTAVLFAAPLFAVEEIPPQRLDLPPRDAFIEAGCAGDRNCLKKAGFVILTDTRLHFVVHLMCMVSAEPNRKPCFDRAMELAGRQSDEIILVGHDVSGSSPQEVIRHWKGFFADVRAKCIGKDLECYDRAFRPLYLPASAK